MTGSLANQNLNSAQYPHKLQANSSNSASQGLAKGTGSGQEGKSQTQSQQEKVLITGDDILIEYVDRLMN